MTLIVKVELILKLMYLCTKIVNNFKNIELFSDWVSTQEDNTNNNGNGLGTSLPNITVNGESTTVDDENTDERELRKLLKDCCEDMDNSTTHSISITPLWSFLTSHYSYRWLSSATQDVHEVYLDLFPHLVNMSTSFQGILCNHYRCLECEHESIQKETFFSLSAFQCYALTTSDRNVLQKKDKYACSYCRIKTEAQYYTSIEKIPPLLFIHSPPSSHVTPHWTWTTFPISLSFAPTHTVQSIICHQGSTLTHGHFISYHLSSSSNLWYKCNDEHLECLQGPPWTSSSSLDFPTMASSKPYPYLSLFKNKI